MIYTARYAVAPSEVERARFDLTGDITRRVVEQLQDAARYSDDAGPVYVEWVAECAHPARNGETIDVPWVPGSPLPLRVRQLCCRGRVEVHR